MPRVKSGAASRARHKKVLSKTKGYKHGRKNVYRQAKQALMKADGYAYRSRKTKKRRIRSLWIIRINAACKEHQVKYSQFIADLTKKELKYNRKELSEMIQTDPKKFKEILDKAIA